MTAREHQEARKSLVPITTHRVGKKGPPREKHRVPLGVFAESGRYCIATDHRVNRNSRPW